MTKAVIQTGGKQYIVQEGDEISVELLKSDEKTATFDALLVFDGDSITVGTPLVDKVKVTADITGMKVPSQKVTSIRYKAKKRVHKVRGHRQNYTQLKIKKIA